LTILAHAGDVDHVLRELGRRIQGILGEPSGPASTKDRTTDHVLDNEAARVIIVGELRVDCGAHRVTVDGEEVCLTGLEFRLLTALAERRDRVHARGALLRDVWGCSELNRTRTVDTHVKRLRDKLGSAGRLIHTIRGVGYRLSDLPTVRSWRRTQLRAGGSPLLHVAPGAVAASG
jgi:DNA-binding response OmpR family regulator